MLSCLVRSLILVGFLASFVALEEANPKMISDAGEVTANKTKIYYAAHAIQIGSLLTAGSLSWLLLNRAQRRTLTLPMAAFLAAGAVMAIRGYTGAELFSFKIVGATGIAPCLLSMLIFFGVRSEHWTTVERMIELTAFVLTVLIAVASIRHPFYSRNDALGEIQGYLIALYVPATFLICRSYKRFNLVWDLVRFLPIAAYAFGSLLTQMRLNLVLLVPALGMYLYVQSRRRNMAAVVMLVVVLLIGALLAVPLLLHTRVGDSLNWSLGELQLRFAEDTRTGQIRAFFYDMSFTDLLFGRGAQASYLWDGCSWEGGIDVGYLMLSLYGGLPLLITYVILHIVPGIKALLKPMSSRQLACAAAVVLWGIRMLSTGYMDFNPGYYCFLLCVGGCFRARLSTGRRPLLSNAC